MFLQNDLVADLQTLFPNVYLLCLSLLLFFFSFFIPYVFLSFQWNMTSKYEFLSWYPSPPSCFSFIKLIWFVFLCASIYGFLFSSCLTETLAMKGLTLNCMDRKSEAYELVRQGLKVVMLAPTFYFFLQ